jgi:hypothetical protein
MIRPADHIVNGGAAEAEAGVGAHGVRPRGWGRAGSRRSRYRAPARLRRVRAILDDLGQGAQRTVDRIAVGETFATSGSSRTRLVPSA